MLTPITRYIFSQHDDIILNYISDDGHLVEPTSCNFVYDHILNIESDSHLIGKYQKNESRIKIILNRMIIQSKERFTIIQQLTENCKLSEIDIRDCLNNEIRDVREQHITIISNCY